MSKFLVLVLLIFCSLSACFSDNHADSVIVQYHSSSFLDSINCPNYVIISNKNSARSFHYFSDCYYIKRNLPKYALISRDSIPTTLTLCKNCYKKMQDSILAESVNLVVNKNVIKKRKKKRESKNISEPTCRDYRDEMVE